MYNSNFSSGGRSFFAMSSMYRNPLNCSLRISVYKPSFPLKWYEIIDRFTPAAEANDRTLTPFRPCLANMGVAAASILERESGRRAKNPPSQSNVRLTIMQRIFRSTQDNLPWRITGRFPASLRLPDPD